MKATYRVYGIYDGHETHRQKLSFAPSKVYDWTERKISVRNSDLTGTNDYTEIEIECDDPDTEIAGQITDGIFENVRTGRIEKKIGEEWVAYDPWERRKN